MRERVVVIGAGIGGCTIAYELARHGKEVLLVEKEERVGGLAKSYRYGDFVFDIGPHRFFTNKINIAEFIRNILGGDSKIILRKSKVYFLGKYHAWPLNPLSLFNLPMHILCRSFLELCRMLLSRKKRVIDNFKDYILEFYGPTLYNIFFEDYTRKFLRLDPEKIHPDWAQESVKRTIIDERMGSRNLWDILKLILNFRPLKVEFIYPSMGIDLFCRRLEEEIVRARGIVQTSASVDRILCAKGRISEIVINGKTVHPGKVVWTGDLNRLCDLMKVPCCDLNYLSLIVYNVEINNRLNDDFQWCYYGSPEIVFSRVTIPSRFDEKMVPANKDSLCVEVTCRENDLCWQYPESLTEQIKKDLLKIGLIGSASEIGNIHIEKISHAYPIYVQDYQKNLQRVKEETAKIENLILAGRTGLFWYNNMDDSIENGLQVASDLLRGAM